MRKQVGILCMLLGVGLLLAAFSLISNNRQENVDAKMFSDNMLPLIRDEIEQIQHIIPTEEQTHLQQNIPEELLKPEDLVMTEQIINGYACIGYLTIPELNLELPVLSNWDSQRLQISPCRYTGTVKGRDLVIMAHNYDSHFGRLASLSEDSSVIFTDMDGFKWTYKVAAMDILAAEAVEEMIAGEYDLTLFTCALNRSQRITIRCNQTNEIQ